MKNTPMVSWGVFHAEGKSVSGANRTTTGSIGNQSGHIKPVLRVLVACERSGRVRQAFRDRGHDAWSCDLLPAGDGSPYHLQGDALPLLALPWDLLIAHPPCTFLSNAYPQHRTKHPDQVAAALAFARVFWEASIPRVCVENPRGLLTRHLGPASQLINPWQFGHPYTKATLLWYRGLPPLFSTSLVAGREMWAGGTGGAERGPRRERALRRSETFQGIADAMADQWG